jgi:hypothetical protein
MFKLTTGTEDGKETKNIGLSGSGWVTLAAAFIAAIASVVGPVYSDLEVNKPKNEADNILKTHDQELEKQKFEFEKKLKEESQSLEKQKFQSELLQSALQGANPKQRAQALRMLVDMKLLDIPCSLMIDFIKNPNTVPRLSPQSAGKPKAPSTSVSGKPIASK